MSNGWIKLHRRILDDESFFRSGHTFTLFIWLLLKADRTGKVVVTRKEIADYLKIKPSTVYQTLQRLQIQQRCNSKSNNKNTTIQICNWDRYQRGYNNEKIEIQQQSNSSSYIDKNIRIKKENFYPQAEEPEQSPLYQEWINLPQPRPKFHKWVKTQKGTHDR